MAEELKLVFNRESVEKLASCLAQACPDFAPEHFVSAVFDREWPRRPLMRRVRHISEQMQVHLSMPYLEALSVIKSVSVHFSGLFHLVFPDYVARFGQACYKESIQVLGMLTRGYTSEYAIRVFLKQSPKETLKQMQVWAHSEDLHLRRLASEGIRPRLPWAEQLDWIAEHPQQLLPIIEPLKADDSLYVRKSVANLLNDLSKSNPRWVVDLCRGWQGESIHPHTQWIIKHALRTLTKQGNIDALDLLGLKPLAPECLTEWQCDSEVRLNETLCFRFCLQNLTPLENIRLEYAISFVTKQSRWSRKVYKIADTHCATDQQGFECHHMFKPLKTRRYYPGAHQIELIVNGRVMMQSEFLLLADNR
ncbi:DNA alkylation repair protein [Thiomicrorhabdus sp. zzn3]|uniref:DNA alkylation repair protein n=1 Tax=Thiomicrorhabdus sp. zzn3 TaxID=3039775 RepID=UPI0024373483|nr:DNA alkylation repair protein [Thiomicrorhabdus sp. zzn3]MDG6777918.1 DNA alkylation repair protein [Thiomicrorhabdus sp. zzn3]